MLFFQSFYLENNSSDAIKVVSNRLLSINNTGRFDASRMHNTLQAALSLVNIMFPKTKIANVVK